MAGLAGTGGQLTVIAPRQKLSDAGQTRAKCFPAGTGRSLVRSPEKEARREGLAKQEEVHAKDQGSTEAEVRTRIIR